MVRKLSWLSALLALCCSMHVFALGLGDVEMHSALNQPINADIDLLAVREGEVEGIKVTLGSTEDFARAGLERPYLLTQLRFLVVDKGKGHYRIHIATEQAVREPFLDFLIQVTWKGGQLQREYTILLDPPVLMPAPIQHIVAPVTKSVSPPPRAEATPPAPTPMPATPLAPESASVAPAPSQQSTAPDSYGPVKRSDTLWGIANRTRPDAAVSVEQMMQAMLRANPNAFINNNVNNLKAGRILRIPSASEIEAITPEEARRDTHTQNVAWRNQRSVAVAPRKAAEPTQATNAEPEKKSAEAATPKPAAAPAPDQVQLKVVTPPPEGTAKPGAAASTPALTSTPPVAGTPPTPTGGDVHKELALTTEAVETQRQETEDLRTRLTDLEQQIATMQKLMSIKDEQLASIQAKSPAGAMPNNGAAANPEPSSALSNPSTLAMIGFAALILAALLWIALRRRQMGAPVVAREVRVEPRVVTPPTAAPDDISSPAAVAAASGIATAAAIRSASQSGTATAVPLPTAKAAPEPRRESDPLSEADIYLAYGRYQQAEDLIKEAMHHDHDPELRMKLLEIYYAAKNGTGFEDAARDLRHEVGVDDALWQRVLPMGRELCPYSMLFSADQNDEIADLAETSFLTPDPTPTATAIPDSYDFDLGTQEDNAAPYNLEATPTDDSDNLDEVGTKLDLARAYIDMGDPEGARSILDEVMEEGSAKQKDEAQELLQRLAH